MRFVTAAARELPRGSRALLELNEDGESSSATTVGCTTPSPNSLGAATAGGCALPLSVAGPGFLLLGRRHLLIAGEAKRRNSATTGLFGAGAMALLRRKPPEMLLLHE